MPLLPPLWLIILIVGLPMLSETVYSPSLPSIAHALHTTEAMAEYTLTIYIFAFALGILFWGKLSDKIGRKPCVIGGFSLFIIGCLGCYLSSSITWLMISRFVQAFGGGVGSVLAQAISRDAFHGPQLGKAYASVGSALGLFPAIGPVIGGFIAQRFGWSNIFLFLILFTMVLVGTIALLLPETHRKDDRKSVSLISLSWQLLKDKKVMGYCLIIAAFNGILFSYFAEGSFCFIEVLGLSPSQYGISFVVQAASGVLGGLCARKLLDTHTQKTLLSWGLWIGLGSMVFFSGCVLWNDFWPFSSRVMIGLILIAQMAWRFGGTFIMSNALALSLVDYRHCIGTASSLFGFFYYMVASLFTLGMGMLHNGTLLPMPLYFFGISFFMLLVQRVLLRR